MTVKTSVLLLLLMPSSHMLSASTDMHIAGEIRPIVPTQVITNQGITDYGQLPLTNFNETNATQLQTKIVILTLTSSAPVKIAFQLTDNRASSSVPANTPLIQGAFADGSDATSTTHADAYLGLGTLPDSTPIGNYIAAIQSITVDSQASDIISSSDSGTTWVFNPTGNTGGERLVSFASTGTVIPVNFNELEVTFKITALVAPINLLGTADTFTMDGKTTITFVYL